MAKHFFSSRDSTSEEMNRFVDEVCRKGDDGSITGILQMSLLVSDQQPMLKDMNSALNPMILLKLWPAD